MGEKRIFSTSTVSSIFKSKEVVDISVINLENIKLWRFLRAKRIDDCMCTLLCCPQGVFVDAKFLRRWPELRYQTGAKTLDCSQSPIFPCDRRDRARLTVNGGHLDF